MPDRGPRPRYVYFYACEKHPLGEFVRDVSPQESAALLHLRAIVPHATNCWVKGCQEPLAKARLAEVVRG